MMKASVLRYESQASQYARLIDRMLVNEHKPQINGSQTTTDKNGKAIFFEIEEPTYIDRRRKEISLGTIADFAAEQGIVWNITQK